MQRYNKYKDSGIEWLGEIPEHWETEKGKWMFVKNERPVLSSYDVVTCFRDGEVTLRKNRREGGFTNSLKEIGYQGILKGDLVIHQMDAFAGAIGVSDSDGKSTPVYSVCSPRLNNISNYFYAYYLRSMALAGVIISLAKGIRERSTDFRFNDFSNLLYPQPPLHEQEAIAQFLDEKCEKIDTAIGLKEQQIEKLKELRQITIHDAVTKGLDVSVTMKDSDIDWIGEMPKHWNVRRLAALGVFSKGGGFSKADLVEEYGIHAILYGDIYTKYNYKILSPIRLISFEASANSVELEYNDLLFTGSGELKEEIGKCVAFKSRLKTIAGGDVIIFKQKNNLSEYLSFCMNTNGAKFEKAKSSKGEIIVHTYASKLREIVIPIPPFSEQEEIVTYLEEQTSKIDKVIAQKQEQIVKLKEYKQSLINEVVTGKIKITA